MISRASTVAIAVSSLAAALTLAGCANAPLTADAPVTRTARRAEAPRVITPAQAELEREIRASGFDDVAKSFMNEETIGLMFGMFRAMTSGKDVEASPALEKKLEQLAEDLPKKLAPVMAKVLVMAEAEMKRAVKAQSEKATKTPAAPDDVK